MSRLYSNYLFFCLLIWSLITVSSSPSFGKNNQQEKDNIDFKIYIDSSLITVTELKKSDLNKAIILTDRLIAESKEYGIDSITNYLKFKVSLYHLLYDNGEKSKEIITEILDYYKDNDVVKYAVLLNRLSQLEIKFGNYSIAKTHVDKAISILKNTDRHLSIGLSYTYLANIYIQQTDYSQAYKYADLALSAYRNRPDKHEYIATAQTLFGQINLLIKDYGEAKRYFDMIFANEALIKDSNFLVRPRLYMGILEYELGHYQKAKSLFETGFKQIRQLGNFPDLSLVYQCLHKIAIEEKDYNLAEAYITKAMLHADKASNIRDQLKSIILFQAFKSNHLNEEIDFNAINAAYEWGLENKDYEILKESSQLMANNLIRRQNYQEAIAFQTVFIDASENIIQSEKVNEINLFKEKAKIQQELSDKKNEEKELKLQLSAENKFRKFMIFSLMVSVLLLSATYYFYHVMKKAYSKLKVTHGELKDAEKILDGKNQELEKYIESNIQLSQFAHIASHDLKSPLRTIGSFTGLLKHKIIKIIGEKELSYFSYIEEATKGLSNLVDDLLKFSTINSQSISLETIDIKKLIEEVLKNISYNVESSNAKINIGEMPDFIYADNMQIRQVFQNLMTNAIKFIPEGRAPKIDISSEKKNKDWLFKISDNGIGIERQYSEKIFKDFARLHNNASYQGTGMGLAICKKIIDKHGGTIWVESEIGNGSDFYFTIPIDLANQMTAKGEGYSSEPGLT